MKNHRRMRTMTSSVGNLFGALLLLILSGCGKSAFYVVTTTQNASAPGTYSIPPKVDILLLESDRARMKQAWDQIQNQVPLFLNQLNQKGWDYHFTSIRLSGVRPINQVVASSYDTNYGSSWTPPYPGANRLDPNITINDVDRSFFSFPSQYGGFMGQADLTTQNYSFEPGFETLKSQLQAGFSTSNFLRKDSLFIPIIVSLADDTSKVNFCSFPGAGDNTLKCENVPNTPLCTSLDQTNCGSYELSFNHYLDAFKNSLKSSYSNIQIHAAVAGANSSNCLGAGATAGSRYKKMALQTGGQFYDLCTQPVSSILASLSSQLQIQKGSFRQRYIFIDQDADPSTIVVKKYINGNPSQVQTIPQSETQGWSYLGYQSEIYAIDAPIQMNLTSGFAIRLNGDSVLLGNDTASVDFKPKGYKNTISK
ncbi:MAG: hypothetical protein ACO3A2_04300 [Bdellovibrionia bacterium]